jgi:hypothetical protein
MKICLDRPPARSTSFVRHVPMQLRAPNNSTTNQSIQLASDAGSETYTSSMRTTWTSIRYFRCCATKTATRPRPQGEQHPLARGDGTPDSWKIAPVLADRLVGRVPSRYRIYKATSRVSGSLSLSNWRRDRPEAQPNRAHRGGG